MPDKIKQDKETLEVAICMNTKINKLQKDLRTLTLLTLAELERDNESPPLAIEGLWLMIDRLDQD